MAQIVLNTEPPTLGDNRTRAVSKWENVFVQNADGETISLDELLEDIKAEVRAESSAELMRSVLEELRAQSNMIREGFGLSDPVASYRAIEPVEDQ